MKLYKELDLWIQVVLILVCTIYPLIDRSFLFSSYFIVGGWQLISSLVHEFLRKLYFPAHNRRYYYRTLFWLLVAGILCWLTPLILLYGMLLLIISPLLAIWYLHICYTETRVLKHKSLTHLK